jgi:non-ribosomal peptide synthetase component F
MLEAAGARYGVTLFMTLLASIKTLLYRNTGQEDIIVGSPVAGRVQPALEKQIGPYLNTLAMRDTVIGDDRFDTLLERVRETTLEAYANQIYPFDLLLEDLSVRRESGRNPLFDVGFTLHNQRRGGATWRSANLEISEAAGADVELRNAEALTDFWFVGEPGPEVIDMTLVYNGNLYREATARRLCEDLAVVVESVGRDPGTRIHGFRLGPARTRTVTEKITIELGF